jgi:hypothetical protein
LSISSDFHPEKPINWPKVGESISSSNFVLESFDEIMATSHNGAVVDVACEDEYVRAYMNVENAPV